MKKKENTQTHTVDIHWDKWLFICQEVEIIVYLKTCCQKCKLLIVIMGEQLDKRN